ncbi:MAG TPA: hypothetical protein VFX28_21725, partial [Methylomirabilota bacterium]|nr:hypothetical protein [Methylomirabilota bacterium]
MLDTSRVMKEAGPPPPEDLRVQLEGLSAAFSDFRARLVQRAAGLGVDAGAPEAIATLIDAEPILAAIQEAESKSLEAAPAAGAEDKRALEGAVQRALSVLTRVLLIGHRDDAVFHPLLECQGKASDLRLKLSRALAGETEYTAQRVDDTILPFADLLTLVIGRENLDDEKFLRIEEGVSRAFGRPLALAGARGRLCIEGLDPNARPMAGVLLPPGMTVVPGDAAAAGASARVEERRDTGRAGRGAEAPAVAPEAAVLLPPPDPRAAGVPWWAAASDGWRAWKGSGVATAHALRAAIAKHPYLLAVPLRRSSDYDEGRLAADYFLLLEHVENVSPAFIRTALDHATEVAGSTQGRA